VPAAVHGYVHVPRPVITPALDQDLVLVLIVTDHRPYSTDASIRTKCGSVVIVRELGLIYATLTSSG
jgi:hypothetical protein